MGESKLNRLVGMGRVIGRSFDANENGMEFYLLSRQTMEMCSSKLMLPICLDGPRMGYRRDREKAGGKGD